MSAKRHTSRASGHPPAPKVRRIDGARHWRKSLDHHVWFLLRAGITPADISDSVARSLHRHRKTKSLVVPDPEVLEYARVLTHWRTQPEYLDDNARPRTLSFAGRSGSFATLVSESIPGAPETDVLNVLTAHRLICKTRDGRIKMLASAFLPMGQQPAQFLAYTLSSIEGIMDTCYSNLKSRDPKKRVGQLQRTVFAERFDMAHLPAYDQFLRDYSATFLADNDAWLKSHEVTGSSRKRRVGYVGVGVFGLKAR
jgi:Family of unknown function (DUF6502)